MNKNDLVKNLKKELQDIYSKINEFENADQIHLIDMDLALSKVRNLYELLSKLSNISTYQSEYQPKDLLTKTEQPAKKENTVTKPVKTEEEPVNKNIIEKEEIVNEEVKVDNDEPLKKEQEQSKEPESIKETNTENEKKDEKKTKTQKNEISPEQNGNANEILADKFHSKKFVHDNIAQKNTKKDVSAKMQSKPIKDINSAIGLNDKFIFIRELFGGDKDHYNETIQILNNFDTYENAIEFLNENFGWDEDDSNFERLKELVQRKYAVK